jgi:hypothetical protein
VILWRQKCRHSLFRSDGVLGVVLSGFLVAELGAAGHFHAAFFVDSKALGGASQWQKLHPVLEIFRFRRLGDEFRILHTLADGDGELVGVDHSCESAAFPLAEFGFSQEIVVLTEKDSPQFTGAVEQAIVRPAGGAIFPSCQDINSTYPQTSRNRLSHMDVHVEGDAHGLAVTLPKRSRSGESVVATAFSRRVQTRGECFIRFLAMIVVIRQRGMDHGRCEMRILNRDFLDRGAMGEKVRRDLDDLDIRAVHPRPPI